MDHERFDPAAADVPAAVLARTRAPARTARRPLC
jgi:hypothetical protein